MPVAGSIQWKPLRDPHYVIASLHPGQGGLRQLVVDQKVLVRLNALARATPAEQLLGLLIGQRWDCPLSGVRWVFIDSLVEGSATVPEAKALAKSLDALLNRRRGDSVECVGWYCGTASTEAHMSRTFAAAHAAIFDTSWQTTLVLANSGQAGAFFLHDARDGRWFQAPFYELTNEPRNSLRQPAQSTSVAWPEYITTALVTPLVVEEPPVVPPRTRVTALPERTRQVRVEVVADFPHVVPAPPAGSRPVSLVRDPSPKPDRAPRTAAEVLARNGQSAPSRLAGVISSVASAVKSSVASLGSRAAQRSATAAQARQARADEARRARETGEAEERARQQALAQSRAEQESRRRAQQEAERAARLEAERAERLEAERTAKLEAERKAKLDAERKAKLEADRARLEAERAARLEAERAARLEAERAAKLEAERVAKLEAERLEKLQADRAARIEAEERARIEAEQRARQQAVERAQREAADRAQREAAERARQEAAERARQEEQRARAEAQQRAKQEAEQRARQDAEQRAKQETERKAAADRRAQRVVTRDFSARPIAEDLEDTTPADGPYRYLALTRREGFQVSAKLERGTPEKPETVWLLNEPEFGLRLTVVTTDEEVREASLHYNIRTDDDALLRITPPEHRDVASRTIYVREPCVAELRSRCRRLRATGALAPEWKVTPTLHPSAAAAQHR